MPLPHCPSALTIVQMNEPRRLIKHDHEKIVVLGFGDRHAGR